jgi:hypothetical protein
VGGRGRVLPWMLLAVGSVASLAANVAVAEPTATGRVIAAWPSFALIAYYELLMRQVRRVADASMVEAAIGQELRQGNTIREIPDSLLTALTGAYHEAVGVRRPGVGCLSS